MKSSYSNDDVEILLKDISGLVEPLPADVREQYIQKGIHYCEMLPLEYRPSERYMSAYRNALENYSRPTAKAVCVLAEKLYRKKSGRLVIVSLARAGIPIGILVKRYLKNKYDVDIKHYAISIIRGRGIDCNAIDYILDKYDAPQVQFVDGWIGKGAILSQLKEALQNYPELDTELGVVSDPANLTELCGTHEDILIPSSCLNATVTGLLSRTFLRSDIIGPHDFHGAAYYDELAGEDLSGEFLEHIERYFDYESNENESSRKSCVNGLKIVHNIADSYSVDNINFIKPGIGETTRVLLRRIPWKIIINQKYADAAELRHIYQLAAEKKIPCEISRVDLGSYKVCGIIKKISDI